MAKARATKPNDVIHEVDFRHRGLRETDVERFREDGVILVRQFFEPTAFQDIIDDLDQRVGLLARTNNLPSEDIRTIDIESTSQRLSALDTENPGAQSIIYDAMSKSPSMHAIASNGDLIGLAEFFVNPPVAHHDRFILLMSMPENTWHLAGWHQDWYYNEGPPGTITVYAPLQRTTEENGVLFFALGEHQKGLLPHGEFEDGFATKWHTIDPAAVDAFDRVAISSLEVGDLFVFNSLVPHAAQVNLSRSIRFVLNLRYHGLDDDEFIESGWRIGEIERARGALSRRQKEESLK